MEPLRVSGGGARRRGGPPESGAKGTGRRGMGGLRSVVVPGVVRPPPLEAAARPVSGWSAALAAPHLFLAPLGAVCKPASGSP